MAVTIRENVLLAPFTTFKIGGPARFFASAESIEDLRSALDWAAQRKLATFILGGGSNLLVSDRGFDGLVIHVDLMGIDVAWSGETIRVKAAAGESWDGLVSLAVHNKWAGFECLSGIPGLVGATPIQNVGAYGQEVAETITEVEVFDRADGTVKTLTNEECSFAYRYSRFKNVEQDRFIVLSVTYVLRPNGAPTVKYPDLHRYFEERGISEPNLQQVRDAVIFVRSRKGMVVSSDDPDSRSAGSFFMNPVIETEELARFLERAAVVGGVDKIPQYPAGQGRTKLSAAWLIEHAGFAKGFTAGNVGISTKHTLALVNKGEGTAAEIVELVRQIQERVQERFGVRLEPEPNFIGF